MKRNDVWGKGRDGEGRGGTGRVPVACSTGWIDPSGPPAAF